MGKKARERKLMKIEAQQTEKQLIEQRRQATREPIVRQAVKVGVVMIITVGLLFLGQTVDKQIAKSLDNSSVQR